MIGAVVFTVARDELAAIDPVYWNFWIGLILCVVVLSAAAASSGGSVTCGAGCRDGSAAAGE